MCGRDEAGPYLQKGDLRLVRCRQCAMIYANPVPAQFASGQYYEQTGAEYYLSPAKLESDYAPVRFDRELRLFRRHCPRGAVLDVGCSTGAFLFQLQARFPDCYEALGTDASGPALEYAVSRGVPVVRGHFPAQDFGGKQFDAVTFWAVLEHLVEPSSFLAKASSVLKSGGLCFVLVPNLQSLAVRALGARCRSFYPQHLNYFTRRTLTNLAQSRFSVIELRSTHFNPLVLWQDWRRRGQEVSSRERAALLKRTTACKENPWLKPAKAVYQLTEKVLGAFNLADNLAAVLLKQ